MPTPEARRVRLRRLYELLAGSDSLTDLLHDLTHVAGEHLDDLRQVSCGLTAQLEGRTVAIASSDTLANELDRIQETTGKGPCLEAIRSGTPVEVTDPVRTAWPAWRERALAHGLRQALSLPLIARGEPLGALNLYSTSSTPFTRQDREAAQLFATHVTGALMIAARLTHLADLVNHLETALTTGGVIDQAKGILVAENHCTPDEAFAILRQASQNRNTKVRELAAQIVATASGGAVTKR